MNAQIQTIVLLDTKAAAERCGLSKATFDKNRVFGRGPKFLKLGRAVRYDIRDLDAWIEQSRRSSTSDNGAAA